MFTTLLFLSGYVLQQQTVRSLQAAIHPKAPSPPVPTLNPVLAKHFGRPPGHSFYDKYLASNRPKGGWAKVAYVQLLRSHMHVCNALMIFAALEGQESMAQRVIMYPRDWDSPSQKADKTAATTRRLLRDAASRFKVMLQPIDPLPRPSPKSEDEELPTLSDEEAYPLTNLLSLITFNRIIYLQPSGLILDVSPLDLLFTLPMSEHRMLGLTSPTPSSADRPAILLFEPSKILYQDTIAALPEGAYPDLDFLSLVHMTPAPPTNGRDDTVVSSTLLAETSSLQHVEAQFNASDFFETTGYIHFQDEGVLGPEFDLTMNFFAAVPVRKEGRIAWEGVYERFREGRMGVCGLDLVPVAAVQTVSESVEAEEEMLVQGEIEADEGEADDRGKDEAGEGYIQENPKSSSGRFNSPGGDIEGQALRDSGGLPISEDPLHDVQEDLR